MKKLFIYCIVDVVSETILSVFSAISVDMAKRQFDQVLEANKDKIYDVDDIVLMVPDFTSESSNFERNIFAYFVPETYDEVVKHFIAFEYYLESFNKAVKED